MSRFRGAEHSHSSATAVRAAYQRSHVGKGHPNDKHGESQAVRKLRDRMARLVNVS